MRLAPMCATAKDPLAEQASRRQSALQGTVVHHSKQASTQARGSRAQIEAASWHHAQAHASRARHLAATQHATHVCVRRRLGDRVGRLEENTKGRHAQSKAARQQNERKRRCSQQPATLRPPAEQPPYRATLTADPHEQPASSGMGVLPRHGALRNASPPSPVAPVRIKATNRANSEQSGTTGTSKNVLPQCRQHHTPEQKPAGERGSPRDKR